MKASPDDVRVSKRVGLFTESVIREMTRLASLHGAVNLAQGFPDFPAPPRVKSAAAAAISEDRNQYEITWGSRDLRQALSEKAWRFNRIRADADQNITVTCGSTEAMASAMVALTDPGDEVIVPEPFYENYVPSTIISGARARHVRMREPDFRFDEEELKLAFSERPKAIIVNTPNNPTGKVFTRGELKLVADLCEDYDALAITDEIYEQIVYDGNKHVSLATIGNMSNRTVTISGMSKTYSVTGWRVGYAVAEKHLTDAIRKVHDFLTVCAPAPLQQAAVAALSMPESYYSNLVRSYDRKRSFILKTLRSLGFKCVEPQGAYYVLADFSQLRKGDDFEFAQFLVRDGGVAVVPASSFYSTRDAARTEVRFTFTKKEETLKEAASRLKARLR